MYISRDWTLGSGWSSRDKNLYYMQPSSPYCQTTAAAYPRVTWGLLVSCRVTFSCAVIGWKWQVTWRSRILCQGVMQPVITLLCCILKVQEAWTGLQCIVIIKYYTLGIATSILHIRVVARREHATHNFQNVAMWRRHILRLFVIICPRERTLEIDRTFWSTRAHAQDWSDLLV